MEFSLRDFRPEDFETLWSIDQRCFQPGIAYSRRELMSYIGMARSFTLVADGAPAKGETADGPQDRSLSNIQGFLVAEAGRRGVGHLITIDVLPEARRFGVGSSLLAAAEERLREANCASVVLETAVDNGSALAFYKRHQYFLVRTVPGYYSNGVDALVMQKDLISQARAG